MRSASSAIEDLGFTKMKIRALAPVPKRKEKHMKKTLLFAIGLAMFASLSVKPLSAKHQRRRRIEKRSNAV